MSGAGRQSAAAATAALLAGVPLFPLTEDRSFLLLGLVLVLLSATIGVLLRRVAASEPLVRLVQCTPVLLIPWLVPEARDPLQLYADTAAYVQAAFAPMPFQIGFTLFCAVLVWLVYLLTETLSVGLASPGWTFPVLVLPYLIPTLALYVESSPFLFAFAAVAYALVLATATRSQAAGPAGTHEATAAGWRRGVATTATIATALALVGSLLISLPIPERTADGPLGSGSGAVQLGDPSLDLVRNLTSPSDRTVITYRSSDGAGHYLRLAALPVFDTAGFHLTRTDLLPLQFGGDRPEVAARGTVRTTVKIGQLDTQYLPMPWFPVTADVAADDWRYDPKTLAVVAVGRNRDTATRNLSYTTTTARLPSAETLLPTLRTAGDPGDGGQTLQLPPELLPGVRQLALDVTSQDGPGGAGAKALALANYLRSGAFRYSTTVTPGTTLGTLYDFLLGNRTGYCEQFAGAMAVLSRVVGIPSRVVVGFLPGKKDDDRWEVSTRNMHAWVELYFGEGVGWVPVDPTPSSAVSGAPASATPSATPSTRTASPTASAAAPAPTTVAPVPLPAGDSGDAGSALGWVAGALALVALAGAGPRLVRAGLRAVRLAPGGDPRSAIERGWAEVRAVALDHGRRWPAGTPRQVAAAFGPELDAKAGSALAVLALAVERTRYDQRPPAATDVAAQVRCVSEAMGTRWSGPRTGRWWPRSLWPAALRR